MEAKDLEIPPPYINPDEETHKDNPKPSLVSVSIGRRFTYAIFESLILIHAKQNFYTLISFEERFMNLANTESPIPIPAKQSFVSRLVVPIGRVVLATVGLLISLQKPLVRFPLTGCIPHSQPSSTNSRDCQILCAGKLRKN